jgi:catechol 2,3-dioxygenase-like lactoylglutathione lyase family enzyme
MFDRVTLGTADLVASRAFYATVMPELGVHPSHGDPAADEWDEVFLAQAGDARPVTTGLHLGLRAPAGRAQIEAFWRTGVDAGHPDDGAPGPRPRYGPDYLGAFLRDPDGNSTEAVLHGNLRQDGVIDHLWIRVADVVASRAFYDALAPRAGFRAVEVTPALVRYSPGPGRGSFTIVAGAPTTPFHLAFSAPAPGAPVLDPSGHRVELVRH